MPTLYTWIIERFSRMSAREQWLSAAVLWVALYALAHFMLILPVIDKLELARSQQGSLEISINAYTLAAQEIVDPADSPQDCQRQEMDARRLELVQQSVVRLRAALSGPPLGGEKVLALLSGQPGPTAMVQGFKTLPSRSITSSDKAVLATPQAFELELQGGYSELVSFLSRAQMAAPWLFWSDLAVSANNYPQLSAKVTVLLFSPPLSEGAQ